MSTTPLLATKIWADAYTRLVPWTMRRHGVGVHDAEEIVQDAIRLFIRAGSVVEPANLGGLLRALGSRVNGIAVNRRRNKSLTHVLIVPADSLPDAGYAPRHMEVDAARKAISTLLERIDGDELATSVVMLIADGVTKPADQARQLGVAVEDIYKARRRLSHHARVVKKTMEEQ